MIDAQNTTAAPSPPSQEKKRPFLGRAILNGRVRFSSVSQIVMYDPSMDGGCPRRWAFAYKWGKKETKTDAQKKGSEEYATSLERYLKTGEDALVPVLRAAKHLFPKPGLDLDVEKPLGDMVRAIQLREALLNRPPGSWPELLVGEIERAAGLIAAGVPIDGAADFRHRRGKYIDSDGALRDEQSGLLVVEIGDLKTTSRINDHTTRSKRIERGYAKTVEQVLAHPQMVGYGVHAANIHPDATHVRLSHVYAQTKHGFAAAKRTGLITVEEVRRRWLRVEGVVREMVDVAATADKPERVPVNVDSCFAYNRECIHAPYCDRPERTVMDMLQIRPRGERNMGNGLFDTLAQSGHSNGAAAPPQMGLFAPPPPPASAVPPPPAPSPPPPPVMGDAERAAQIDAEKKRLLGTDTNTDPGTGIKIFREHGNGQREPLNDAARVAAQRRHPLEGIDGYTVGQGCNGRGYYANQKGQGFIDVEAGHVHTPACAIASPAPPPPPIAIPHIGAVNPADGPARDSVVESTPLSAEAIAAIVDPEVRARAEEHARAHAARAAAEAALQPAAEAKTTGRCPGAKQTIATTPALVNDKKIDCPVCGKSVKLKKTDFSADFATATVPGHMMAQREGASASGASPQPPAPPTAPVAAAPPPPSIPAPPTPPPAAPVAAAPPPPPPSIPAPPVGAHPATVPPAPPSASSPPAPPAPPTPPAPPSVSVASDGIETIASITPAPNVSSETIAAALMNVAGIVLYVDVVFQRGAQPKSLDDWAHDIVSTLERHHNLTDLRLASNTTDLGYGKWKGALAAMARANVPPPGEYVLCGVSSSEIREAIVEGLAPLCARVVRGSAR